MSVSAALSTREFESRLAFGQVIETRIARWLLARGAHILPVYDIEYETGKGPRLFSAEFQAACPDMLFFGRGGCIIWVEAKGKSVFTWYRKSNQWQTGIDLHHYQDYKRVQETTGLSVWLMFLQTASTPWEKDKQMGCPPECPTGLFACELDTIPDHSSDRHGRHGMVYWNHQQLRLLAEISEVPA